MKLTKQQEQFLINYGLTQLLKQAEIMAQSPRRKVITPKTNKRKWSPEQRAKFSKSMAKLWRKKKVETHGQTV